MAKLKVIFHAPTAAAFNRAKANAIHLKAARPEAEVRIVANAEAVPLAVATRDPETDSILVLCENSLRRQNLQAPAHIMTTPISVVVIAELQRQGWQYIRA